MKSSYDREVGGGGVGTTEKTLFLFLARAGDSDG
jgi:hypothetical protein